MAGDTQATILDDILSSTFDISRVLNSLGLHAHALVRARRGRTFSTWRRSRKRPASLSLSVSLSLSLFFSFLPVPPASLLTNYCPTVPWPRFFGNGFLHASSFLFSLFLRLFSTRPFRNLAADAVSRSTYRAKQIMQAHFRAADRRSTLKSRTVRSGDHLHDVATRKPPRDVPSHVVD